MLTCDQKIDEVYDRVKRIETRLTNYLMSIGFETHATPCTWAYPNKVLVPSERTSIGEMIAVVPEDVHAETVIEVWCRERCVMVFHASARATKHYNASARQPA